MQLHPIACHFARLPNDLQREIYKMATHNPLKPIQSVEREYSAKLIFEFRQTPMDPITKTSYTIQTTWDIRESEPTIRYMYVHRYTPHKVECVMSLNEDIKRVEIREWQLAPYLHDLIATFRARKM